MDSVAEDVREEAREGAEGAREEAQEARNYTYAHNVLGRMVARQTGYYWGTSGHTPEPVVVGLEYRTCSAILSQGIQQRLP